MNRLAPHLLALAVLIAVSAAGAPAASSQPAASSPLDPTHWGVVMGAPGTAAVRKIAGVPYGVVGGDTLRVDLYVPPRLARGETRPAVVFLNAIGDAPGQTRVKDWAIYASWPRLVAAHGMIGVSMDASVQRIPESLAAVFEFLGSRAAAYGVDGTRLGCYAASANVTQASQYLLGDSAHAGIRAAVLYYGAAPSRAPKQGLPVLFVVAEGDMAGGIGASIPGLWQRVVDAKAPWTLAFASDLPHAFDAFSDDETSRRMVRATIDFWRTHLEAAPPSADPPSDAREIVESIYWNDPEKAAAGLAAWVAKHPDDAAAHVQHGRMLSQLRRFPEASAAYERAQALGSKQPGLYVGLGQIRNGQQRWAEAIELLREAIALGARNSQTWGALAWAQLNLGRNEDAVASYRAAIDAGIPPGPTTLGAAWYNLACGYARLGRSADALDALERAVAGGYANRAGAEADPDLAPLRGEPRWAGIVASIPPPAASATTPR